MKGNFWLRKCAVGVMQMLIGTAVLLSPASVRADPPGSGWALTFSDDFNGTALDTNKWNTCYWWSKNGCSNGANGELQWYQNDDISVQNGALRLSAQKRSVNGYSYTAGMISSHDKYAFQYGYAEMRAKMPKGRGLWPAFWLVPQARNVWPPELDVVEYLGHDPTRVHMTLHYKTSSGNKSSASNWAGPDLSAEYHTYAVQWNSKYIIWYVDGVERKRYEVAENIPAQPLHIIANLAVGGAWSNTPPDATTPFPSYFDIDYIKVWRNNSSPSTPTLTSITTETEGLAVEATSGDTHQTFTDTNLSGGVATKLGANAENDYVTYTVDVPEARTYNVRVGVKKLDIRGRFQLVVNGTNYGSPQDLYAASASFVELDLADIAFNSSGDNSFKFVVTGKNASSKGYTLALDYIKLVPK